MDSVCSPLPTYIATATSSTPHLEPTWPACVQQQDPQHTTLPTPAVKPYTLQKTDSLDSCSSSSTAAAPVTSVSVTPGGPPSALPQQHLAPMITQDSLETLTSNDAHKLANVLQQQLDAINEELA